MNIIINWECINSKIINENSNHYPISDWIQYQTQNSITLLWISLMTTDNLPVLTPKTPGFAPGETADLSQAWTRLGSDQNHTWTKGSIWLLILLAQMCYKCLHHPWTNIPTTWEQTEPSTYFCFDSHGTSSCYMASLQSSKDMPTQTIMDNHGTTAKPCLLEDVAGGGKFFWASPDSLTSVICTQSQTVLICEQRWPLRTPLRPGASRQMLVGTDPTCVLGLGAALMSTRVRVSSVADLELHLNNSVFSLFFCN